VVGVLSGLPINPDPQKDSNMKPLTEAQKSDSVMFLDFRCGSN